jgi:hypothetical protein
MFVDSTENLHICFVLFCSLQLVFLVGDSEFLTFTYGEVRKETSDLLKHLCS